ncbi:Tetratricopeptide repeat protein [Denitrovibrio acetiphilus DSM 12809]|uniref:Tetratricopeptide repeat protein n=1 Tax=Denitrovibrio acetiphilus (strain DSM 12809 / NBRC 114555 / N2460) TaxID=522772 RepID=D4H8M4_DENA2|nr:tetratricopeptide repeat protein [Denitrovibrio acetiphilus]ADD68373.1 Tetratricopeptide repeat protein [Denitrovibrio acetiphilus DSM 12809]
MKYIIVFFMMFWSVYALAEEKLPVKLAKVLYEAQQMMRADKYAEAILKLEDYRLANSEDAGLYYLVLGNAYYKDGRVRDAYTAFSAGLSRYSENEDLCRNSAVAAYELKNYSAAHEYFYRLYRMTVNPEHLFRAAVSLYLIEDMQGADRLLEELMTKNKEPETEWVKLAVTVKMEMKRWRSASVLLRDYLEKFPQDAKMWRVTAQVYLNMEQFSNAASAIETAYSIESPKRGDIMNLADIYSYAGAPVRAAETLAKISRTEEELIHLAEHYAIGGDYLNAVRITDGLIESGKNRDKYYKLKGKYLYQAGEYSRALETLKNSEQRDGDSLMLLAVCAWHVNDLNTVKTAYEKALTIPAFRKTAQSGLNAVNSLMADAN